MGAFAMVIKSSKVVVPQEKRKELGEKLYKLMTLAGMMEDLAYTVQYIELLSLFSSMMMVFIFRIIILRRILGKTLAMTRRKVVFGVVNWDIVNLPWEYWLDML